MIVPSNELSFGEDAAIIVAPVVVLPVLDVVAILAVVLRLRVKFDVQLGAVVFLHARLSMLDVEFVFGLPLSEYCRHYEE